MKKLELVDKEVKQTITLDEIDTKKHLVVIISDRGYNSVLRGNNDCGWKVVYSDGVHQVIYSTIHKCIEMEVAKSDKIEIYEL